jgi:hypothetical protein
MNISPPETTESNAYSNATTRGSGDVQMQRNPFDGSPVEESLPPRMHMEDSSIHKLGRSSPTIGLGLGAINRGVAGKLGELDGKLSPSSSSGSGLESKLAEIRKASSSAHLHSKGVASKLAEIQKASAAETIKAKGADAGAHTEVEKKKRKRKSWKKPKDKPKRPLSAYNLFFQAERAIMLGDAAAVADKEKKKPNKKRVHRKSHGKIGFAEMARVIGSKWKSAKDEDKKSFEGRAEKERKRYEVELEAWKETQRLKTLELELEAQQQQGMEAAAAVAHQSSLLAAMQQQQQQQQMPSQQGGMGSLGMSSHGNFPADSASYSMMMTDTERLLQQRQHQQQQVGGEYLRQPQGLSPSIEYLRALQERRQLDRAGLLNPPGMMDTLTQTPSAYPNAAAASANAIMQMQQQQLQQQQLQQQQLQAQLRHLNASSRMGGAAPMGAATNVGNNQSQDDFELQYLTMLRQRQQQQQQQQQQGQQLSDMNEYSGGMNNYGSSNQGNMNLYGDRRPF